MSYVSEYPSISSASAVEYFAKKLALETDCSDVYRDRQQGNQPFVLLHVIGSAQQFAACHIPGALHLPYGQINQQSLAHWPADRLFVVYCAGPHCNGADRAALKLAQLGRPVKVMPGGLQGWRDEGYRLAGK